MINHSTHNPYHKHTPYHPGTQEKLNNLEATLASSRNTMALGYGDPVTGELVKASSVQLRNLMRTSEDERVRKVLVGLGVCVVWCGVYVVGGGGWGVCGAHEVVGWCGCVCRFPHVLFCFWLSMTHFCVTPLLHTCITRPILHTCITHFYTHLYTQACYEGLCSIGISVVEAFCEIVKTRNQLGKLLV